MLKIAEKTPLRLKKLVYTTLLAMLPAACYAAPNEPPPPQSSQAAKPPPPTAKETKIRKRLSLYLSLMRDGGSLSQPPLGSWRRGEIEIVLNPDQIKKVENQTKLRLISRGATEIEAEKWSSVGVVAEDNYWMWIRDAVIFPSGVYGTYDRLLWKSGMDGIPGVAVLPILANKKIVVNLNYRHATRSWEIELPRGQKKEGETLEQAALRELKEETGYQLTKCTLLGTTAPDSGVLMSLTPLFHGEVSYSGDTKREYSDAISQNPAFTKQELKEGIVRGYIEVPIQGQLVRVNCRDPVLAFALIQAEGKGLL